MNKNLRISLVLALLSVLTWAFWLNAGPAATQAQAGRLAALAGASPETWNLGITVEGSPSYPAIAGRLVSDFAAFRSARAYRGATIFPAPASTRTIQAASFYLLSRTGDYSGNVSLSLGIFDYSGDVQHIVNLANIDLKTAPVGVWTPVALSAIPEDLIISPGEFLAFFFSLDGVAGGDLDLRPIFEVTVY